MDLTSLILTGLGLYFVLLMAIGIVSARNQDHQGFVIGNRNVGPFALAASSIATMRDGAFASFWLATAFIAGYATCNVILGVLVGGLVLLALAPAFRQAGAEGGYITAGQLVRDRIGPWTEKMTATIVLVTSLCIACAQLYVGSELLAAITDLPQSWIILATALLVGFYLWAGGYATVVKTDLIQFAFIIFICSVPFLHPPEMDSILAFDTLLGHGWPEVIALFLNGILWPLANADMIQRLFSSRDDRSARTGLWIMLPILCILPLVLIMIGLYLRDAVPDADPDNLISVNFDQAVMLPWVLAGLGISLVAMSMSTLDSQVYLFTSTTLRNFVPPQMTEDRDSYIRLSRFVMIGMLGAIVVLALFVSTLMELMFGIISVGVILAACHVIAIKSMVPASKACDRAMAASLMVATLVFLVMLAGDMFGTSFVMSTIPAGIATLLGACLYIGFYLRGRLQPDA